MENCISETLELEKAVQTLGFATASTKGISMLPFIVTGRVKVIVEKCGDRLRKHDIGVFRRKDGQFLMHRVKKVRDGCYDFLGDNNLKKETAVPDCLVIGVVYGYFKNEKFVDCKSFSYRFKTKLYCFPPIRFCGVLTIRLLLKIRNLFRKLFKRK